jgi:hypothetical protein
MATHTNLSGLFTDIADAIREKNGSTAKIVADNFPTVIRDIPVTGGSSFPNGTKWTQSNITSGSFKSVYNANGIWVAGSEFHSGLYYSVDGKEWTQSNITSGGFQSVYNANGIWVAGSGGDSGLYYSVSWEPTT